MGITLYLNHHGNQFAYFGHQLPSIGLVPKLLFSMPVPQNEDVYVAMSVPLRKKMIILMVKKDGHNQVLDQEKITHVWNLVNLTQLWPDL